MEDITPESHIELPPETKAPRRFERARHYLGAAAAGAYMITLGPNARRIWSGVAGATAAFMFTPPENFSVGPLEGDVRFASPIDTQVEQVLIFLSLDQLISLPTKGRHLRFILMILKTLLTRRH